MEHVNKFEINIMNFKNEKNVLIKHCNLCFKT